MDADLLHPVHHRIILYPLSFILATVYFIVLHTLLHLTLYFILTTYYLLLSFIRLIIGSYATPPSELLSPSTPFTLAEFPLQSCLAFAAGRTYKYKVQSIRVRKLRSVKSNGAAWPSGLDGPTSIKYKVLEYESYAV